MLFYSKFDDAEDWRQHLQRAMPGLDFRAHPDVGNPADIESAMVWKAPPGEMRKYPNLKLIVNIGAGVDYILKDDTLPPDVPIMRLVDPEQNRMMAQYVLLAVLRYAPRLSGAGEAAPRAALAVHPSARERYAADRHHGARRYRHARGEELLRLGFAVSGWSRTPKSVEGVAHVPRPRPAQGFSRTLEDPDPDHAVDAGHGRHRRP